MLTFTKGNLLESDADALVNTVNTEGIMGKGIALMFKEAFPENFRAYAAACKRGEVAIGRMFVTERQGMLGPRWIVNFPTKRHWRRPSKIEWIEEGLIDLKHVIAEKRIRSIALPPLGSGNGMLEWATVRRRIEAALSDLGDVAVTVYEPTAKYQNVSKRTGVEKLTPPRALIAELVRRYSILGFESSVLEVQKLAYFLGRFIEKLSLPNTLKLQFRADRFGPYSLGLTHLLDALDGSYLHCEKRLADAKPLDAIWFEDAKRDFVAAYLNSPEAKAFRPALEATTRLIDGYESPFGLELLATVDWLLHERRAEPNVAAVRESLKSWPAGADAAQRKRRLFDERAIGLALARLAETGP
jgi:O-acetyl-ADP-ribose deacetylase (regulator of RNase III)